MHTRHKDEWRYRSNVFIEWDGKHGAIHRSSYNISQVVFQKTMCRPFKVELESCLFCCIWAGENLRSKSITTTVFCVASITCLLSTKFVSNCYRYSATNLQKSLKTRLNNNNSNNNDDNDDDDELRIDCIRLHHKVGRTAAKVRSQNVFILTTSSLWESIDRVAGQRRTVEQQSSARSPVHGHWCTCGPASPTGRHHAGEPATNAETPRLAWRKNKKLSCRRETARRFVSFHILLSRSRSFEMTMLSRACVSFYYYCIETMYLVRAWPWIWG